LSEEEQESSFEL